MFYIRRGLRVVVLLERQCESLKAWNDDSRTPRFFYMPIYLNNNPHSWEFLCSKNLSFMSNKKQNEELQSRREFFKKAAKAALPVVGAVVLSSVPFVKAEAAKTGCYYGGCTYGCEGGCNDSCYGSCKGTCNASCQYTCRAACMSSCNLYTGY